MSRSQTTAGSDPLANLPTKYRVYRHFCGSEIAYESYAGELVCLKCYPNPLPNAAVAIVKNFENTFDALENVRPILDVLKLADS